MPTQESSIPRELLETVEKALTTENGSSILKFVIENPKCAYRDIRLTFPKIGAATVAGTIDDFVQMGIVSKEKWMSREVPEEERQNLKKIGYDTKAPYLTYQPFALSEQFAQYKSSLLSLIKERTPHRLPITDDGAAKHYTGGGSHSEM